MEGSLMLQLSDQARRLYDVMRDVARDGLCKANQRELRAATGMAFKTIIPARDELVSAGLLERIMHKRGRRDWYRVVPMTQREREIEQQRRQAKIDEERERLVVDSHRELTLF